MKLERAFSFTTGAQIRAARALLGWHRRDLADASGLHPNAVAYWERAEVIPPPLPSGRWNREPHACKQMRAALESMGVILVAAPSPGVCLVRE